MSACGIRAHLDLRVCMRLKADLREYWGTPSDSERPEVVRGYRKRSADPAVPPELTVGRRSQTASARARHSSLSVQRAVCVLPLKSGTPLDRPGRTSVRGQEAGMIIHSRHRRLRGRSAPGRALISTVHTARAGRRQLDRAEPLNRLCAGLTDGMSSAASSVPVLVRTASMRAF